eukprot:8052885-Lingulodinium_polyedra.AAC.1
MAGARAQERGGRRPPPPVPGPTPGGHDERNKRDCCLITACRCPLAVQSLIAAVYWLFLLAY